MFKTKFVMSIVPALILFLASFMFFHVNLEGRTQDIAIAEGDKPNV